MPKRLKHHTVRALRWSEQYTKIDMVYFASGSFWQTFGQGINSIIALLLTLIFANFLPKETYGIYRYVISLAGILNIFTLTGMNQAVGQAIANGREGILRTAVRYQLRWNSILMFGGLLLGSYYLIHQNFELTFSILILSVCIPLTAAFNTYGAYLAGKREFRLTNIFSVLSTLIYAGGMVAAIFASGQVIWLVAAYALTTLVSTAVFYFVTLHMFKPPVTPADDVLKYGWNMTYINLLAPVVAQIDSIILEHFWGPVQLAVYSIAMAIPNRAVPLVKDLVDLGFPKMAVKTPEELDRILYKRMWLGFIAGGAIAGAYILVAPYAFKYLMPQYLDAVLYSQLLALSFVFAMPTRYLGLLFTTRRLSRPVFISNTVQNIIRFLLYVVLGTWGGILGLVIAQLIGAFNGVAINLGVWLWFKDRA